jgi:hypothetical protein
MNYQIMRLLALVFVTGWVTFASAQDVPATLSVDGKPALRLKVPMAAKLTSTNAYLKVVTTNLELYIWAVPNAKTLDDALPRVADIIKSEFIKFKPAATKDVEVAGASAKDVTGPGNEADDEDPGNAEVVFFVAGGHVFAACVHGEFDNAAKERVPMMAVLATAQSAS